MRYIVVEEAYEDMLYAMVGTGYQSRALSVINRQPTADVEPIVHAHWIKHELAEEVEGRLIPNYECSHCHEWFRDNRRRCGECGAKMDEAVKDDD